MSLLIPARYRVNNFAVMALFRQHSIDILRLNLLLRRDNRLSTLLFENSQANLKQLQLPQKDLHKFLIGKNGIFLFDLLASWASGFFTLSSRLGDEPIVHAVKIPS